MFIQIHVFLVGSHGAASSSHSECLTFFCESDEGPSSAISASHWSPPRPHAGLKIHHPSARCKENSLVLSNADPDIAEGGGNCIVAAS